MRSLVGSIINKAPVAFAARTTWQFPFVRRNDAEAQMRSMGAVGTLFAIVHRLSNATSQINWRLFKKAASGLKEDRVEVTRHAALDLWAKPNPFMTRQEFVETFQQHIDLAGEGWWVVGRSELMRSLPLELWPVRPDRMDVARSATDFLTGYFYLGPDGEQVPLPREDVVQLRMPNPLDPYRGMGPVQSILTELEANRYSGEWNRNFFLNSAEPGGIIEVEKRLSDDEFDEMTTRWREQHQGIAQSHRVAVLEQGKWVDRKYTQKDMQFAELRAVTRDEIREAFGFPTFMLGTVTDVNRANAEASDAMFARWLIVPRLERIKGALNNDLLPLFGPTSTGLEFDYDNPVPEDEEAENAERDSKIAALKVFIETGGFDPTSSCEALDLPVPAVAATATGETASPQQIADMIQKVYLGVDAVVTWEEARTILNAAGANLDLSVPAPTPAAPPFGNRLRLRNSSAPDINLDQVQANWVSALDDLLGKWRDVTAGQRRQIEQAVRTAVATHDVTALSHIQINAGEAETLLQLAMAAMAAQGVAQMVSEAADQDVHVHPPTVSRDQLDPIATAIVFLLADSLANAGGREALRLYSPGADADEVATAVTAHLEGLSDAYLRDNLGGALTRAQNVGRLTVLSTAPQALYFSSEQMDTNTCKPCREINGTQFEAWIDAWNAYAGGPYKDCLGGNRCRGTVVAQWNPAAGE